MSGLSLDHPWIFAFGLLGNLVSFMVYLAPIPTFYRIYRKKSTEGFQSVPYVVALFSAMLWIYYAFIKTNEYLLITINTVGCVIETIYIVMFLVYAPKKIKINTAKMVLLLNVGLFSSIVLSTLLIPKGANRVKVLGWMCVGFAVSVFAAPLSIIRQVFRTKSVEFMPFSLSLSLTVSAVVWFSYGLLKKDIYIAIPNILGFCFGVVQMVLYLIYKDAIGYIDAKDLMIIEDELPVSKLHETEEIPLNIVIIEETKLEEEEEKGCSEDKRGMEEGKDEIEMSPV